MASQVINFSEIKPITAEITAVLYERLPETVGMPYFHFFFHRKRMSIHKVLLGRNSLMAMDLDEICACILDYDFLGPAQRKKWHVYFLHRLRMEVEANVVILNANKLVVSNEKSTRALFRLKELCMKFTDIECLITPSGQSVILPLLFNWLFFEIKNSQQIYENESSAENVALFKSVREFRETADMEIARLRDNPFEVAENEEDGIPSAF